MKYVKFVIETICLTVYQVLMIVLGVVLLPFFVRSVESFDCSNETSRPNVRFKNSWVDSIWGNSEDGLDGDVYYKTKYSNKLNWWTRYNWVALRNPIHNLALRQGVNEVIVNYLWKGNRYTEDRIGREGWVYSEAVGASGKVYPMFRWCKLFVGEYGIECNIGYKNFCVQEVGKLYTYSFTVSINPFKKFEPGREG